MQHTIAILLKQSLTECLPAVDLLKSRGSSRHLWQYGTSYKAMCGREREGSVRHRNGEEQLLEVIGSIRTTDLARAIAPFLLAALCSLLFLLQLKGAELKVGSSLSLDLIHCFRDSHFLLFLRALQSREGF